jgi:hypothetical protein
MRYDLLWHESGLDRVDVIPYFVLDEDKVTDGIVPLVMEPQNAIELFNALKDVWVRLHQ